MTTPPLNTVLPGAEPPSSDLVQRLCDAFVARGPSYRPRTHHLEPDGRPRYTNRLIVETSPYLLQHAHNPVSWWPWSDEAFAEARRLGRPVFLSIGYSTCHWCHVMEAESFEDEEIAAFLNGHFIPIKVDREERPDVDAVYMSAVQQLTGSGGWPMSVFLDPDRRPFFGGTYFPPRDGARGARKGFLSILKELAATTARDPERVQRATVALTEAVRADMSRSAPPAEGVPSRDVITAAVDFYRRAFDAAHGGLRRAPKFPSNLPARLLLRHHHRTGDPDALHMAIFSLEKMAAGGMYDQLGGGFHRYSTDQRWLVPHFEKMLYDNALLAVAYVEAHQATGREDMARIAREICDYVLREMTDPDGGFYSATDADSQGEEGRFFVWTEAEIRSVLGDGPDTETFLRHYDVRPEGNWEGSTILNVPRPDEQVTRSLRGARDQLLEVRARREPPLRDEKVLAAWNGLMISALANAGRVLDQPRYVDAARRAAEFLLAKLRPDGETLFRSFKDSRSSQRGFLDDYAFVAAGLLDLFEATFEPRWLEHALALADATERLFADQVQGGWFMTSDAHDVLIAREKPAYDGAEPSGTSVALMNACRLAVFTDDARWRSIAERAFRAHAETLAKNPVAMTEALLALDFFLDRPFEIFYVWPTGLRRGDPAEAGLGNVLRSTFLPSRVLAGGSQEEVQRLSSFVPFARARGPVANLPTVYVCREGRCDLPVTSPDDLMRQLAPAGGFIDLG